MVPAVVAGHAAASFIAVCAVILLGAAALRLPDGSEHASPAPPVCGTVSANSYILPFCVSASAPAASIDECCSLCSNSSACSVAQLDVGNHTCYMTYQAPAVCVNFGGGSSNQTVAQLTCKFLSPDSCGYNQDCATCGDVCDVRFGGQCCTNNADGNTLFCPSNTSCCLAGGDPKCCPEHHHCCGGSASGTSCCAPHDFCSVDQDTGAAQCCPANFTTLCGGQCCADDSSCVNGGCCPVPCGEFCCDEGQVCSSGMCCPAGHFNCDSSTCCWTANETCSQGQCCPKGQTACDDGCCPDDTSCCVAEYNNMCCSANTTCCNAGNEALCCNSNEVCMEAEQFEQETSFCCPSDTTNICAGDCCSGSCCSSGDSYPTCCSAPASQCCYPSGSGDANCCGATDTCCSGTGSATCCPSDGQCCLSNDNAFPWCCGANQTCGSQQYTCN